MAHLQLAVCSRMDPVASNPRLPTTNQERCHSDTLKEQSQVEHLRTNIQQQFLRSKDEKLAELQIQKERSSSCSQPAESSRLILEKAGFCSAGSHSWYLKEQASTLPLHWGSKRRGVDRSYPLKPVLHHKAGKAPLPSSWQAQPIGVPSPFSIEQSKRATSHLRRAEPGCIQKLEAAGQSLEEEIQRKEALLKEKLRRTEEELRRIQWERQQAETGTRRERGELVMPEVKAGVTQSHASRSSTRSCSGQKVHVPESPIASVGAALLPQVLHMERLKKQRLVASNSKMRENVSQISATCSPELAPKHVQAFPAVVSSQQVACVAAEPLHMEVPSSVEDWGECSSCGRRLYCSRLEKHISICNKNHGSKRKVFDSSKARAKGTELETYHLLKGSDISQVVSCPNTDQHEPLFCRQSNWRQKHESFIKTLRRAREVQRVISKGGKASDLPPVPAMENPDYKLCPYCTRQFAPKVAERHIPKCKNIKNRPPPPQQKRRC
uniref:Zinc finger C2HC-type containing 1C n=1 Tax=Varanus komodoensis TaxID=61221 RepID=A0A8D2Q6W1_VARKO